VQDAAVNKPNDALYASINRPSAPPPSAPPQPTPPPAPPPSQSAPSTPPPAPVAPQSSAAAEQRRHRPAPAQTHDNVVEDRPVRVGKIQWPPPRVDDAKPEMHVGRLDIEESDENKTTTSTRPTADVRQRIYESIADVRQNQPSSTSLQPVRQSVAMSCSFTNTKAAFTPGHMLLGNMCPGRATCIRIHIC